MQHAKITRILTLAAALGLLAGLPTHAADGRFPIYEVPTTITEPGSYYLTRDLSYAAPAPMITIEASNVTLDLAGHTLEHEGNTHPVIVTSGTPTNLEIFGGRVVGGRHALWLLNFAGATFDVRVRDLMIQGTFNDAIRVESGFEVDVDVTAVVRNVQISGAGGNGIVLRAVDSGHLGFNTIAAPGAAGVHIDNSNGILVADNTIVKSGTYGVLIEASWGCAIERNLLSQNDEYGLVYRDIGTNTWVNCHMSNRMLNNGIDAIDLQNTSSYSQGSCE